MVGRRLNILELNAQSLVGNYRRVELENMLARVSPDLMMISETRLKERHVLGFPNYTLFRNDMGQGAALLIKNKFKYNRLFDKDIQVPYVLAEANIITRARIKRLLVGSFYIPNNINIEVFYGVLNRIEIMSLGFDSVVIGGDWNAKHGYWGNGISNVRGNKMFQWLNDIRTRSNLYIISPMSPTFPPGASTLDFSFLQRNFLEPFLTTILATRLTHFLTTMQSNCH